MSTSLFNCSIIVDNFYNLFNIIPKCKYNPIKYYWLYYQDTYGKYKYKSYFGYKQNMEIFSNNTKLICGTTLAFYENNVIFLRNLVHC